MKPNEFDNKKIENAAKHVKSLLRPNPNEATNKLIIRKWYGKINRYLFLAIASICTSTTLWHVMGFFQTKLISEITSNVNYQNKLVFYLASSTIYFVMIFAFLAFAIFINFLFPGSKSTGAKGSRSNQNYNIH